MAKQSINVGTSPNDNRGDSLRISFQKINANFTELYNATGGGLDLLNVASHIVPATDITYDLGSTTKRFRHVYVGPGSIYIDNARLSLVGGKIQSSVGFALTDTELDAALPSQTGNAGKFLTTDGTNTLSWATVASAYTLPTATTSVLGGVKVDGSTITINNGVISSSGGSSFNGSTAALTLTGKIPYAQPVLVAPPVTFTRPNNSTNTVDVIDTGVTFKRVNNGALFNSAAGETSWNQSQSPLGTEWNFDGWGDLADVKTRTYTTFNNAIQDWGAANIHHREFVMHDKINDKYYTFKFSWWQANGGGGANQSMDEKSGFTYVRQLINTDPTVVFVHPAGDANTNQDDIDSGLSITRGTNGGGIYNAQEDSEWDPDTTPYGTLWNDEGWDDFADITTRTWKPFFTAVHGRLGNELVGRKLLMKDTANNKYYLIKFTEWGEDNGGSFAYTRREVNPTGTKLGITFADGTKQLTANTLGSLKIVDDNAIYNAAQPGHGAEIRSDVENNYSFNTYYWTGDANWVTTGDQGLVEFNITETWQQDFARFLSNLDRWLTVTVRINDGPAQTITDWWSEGFVTKEPPATDPTLVTNLRFDTVFRSRMYMGGEENVGFYLDKQNESFKVDSRNIYLTAGESENFNGSIYASGWGTVELRSNNPNNSVNIVADGDNTAKTWVFNANGKLQLPAGGDIVASDGTTSVLGGGSTGSIRFDGTWIKNVDTGNIFISPQDGNTFLDLPSDTQASSSTVRLGNTDATGGVRIQAGDAGKYWEFKHNGITKFPSNTIKTSSSLVIQALTGVPTGSVTKLGGNQGWGAGSVGNNLATTGGSGTGLTVNVIDSGSAYSGISINTPGSGYVDGDVITVTNGGMSDSFTIRVPSSTWSFDADGAITTNDAFTVKTPSSTFIPSTWNGGGGWNQGYYSNVATTGGTGTGLTVNVGAGGGGYINISAISISNPGSGYTAGDVITINNENNIPGSFTLVAVPNTWEFNTDGSITFPTQTTRDYANRTSYTTGPTLQLKDNGTDATAVITGPAATEANQTAKRLVIQGQPGWRDTSTQPIGAEGGDVYIWAGYGGEGSDTTGPGGDVKLKGGNGGFEGGYIRLEAGNATSYNGVGGFLDLNAGDATSGYYGGTTATGGDVNIRGGQGYGTGGSVNINAGEGQTTDGAVYVNTVGGDYTWTFGADGNLTIPTNGAILSNDALNGVRFSLRAQDLAADKYITVRGGGGENYSHLHIDSGDNSLYDIFLGDDFKYVQVGRSGEIAVKTAVDYTNHSFTITSISQASPVIVGLLQDPTTYFTAGSKIKISGVTTTTNANGTWYAGFGQGNDIVLYQDALMTLPVDGTAWNDYVVTGSVTANNANNVGNNTFSAYSNTYPLLSNVRVGWLVSGANMSDTAITAVNTADGGGGTTIYSFTVASGTFTYGQPYDFIGEVSNGAGTVFSGGVAKDITLTSGHSIHSDRGGHGNVVVNTSTDTTPNAWRFGNDGKFTLPDTGTISVGGEFRSFVALNQSEDNSSTIRVNIPGTPEAAHLTTDWKARIDGTLYSISAVATNGVNREISLFTSDTFAVETSVAFILPSYDWQFSLDGTTTVPGLVQTTTEEDLVLRTRAVVDLSGGFGLTNKDFIFGTNGSLTVPDDLILSTNKTITVDNDLVDAEDTYRSQQFQTNEAFYELIQYAGWPWGVDVPLTWDSYAQLVAAGPAAASAGAVNYANIPILANNTRNAYLFWQNSVYATKTTIRVGPSDWVFNASQYLELPNSATIGTSSNQEVTDAETAYNSAIDNWELARLTDWIQSPGATISGWPFAYWGRC